MSRIAVGVDGSPESRAAMLWAADEARRRGARLEVVHVYDDTPAYELYAYPTGLRTEERDAMGAERAARHARALVDDMVARLEGGTELDIEPITIKDRRPARALIEHAKDADMLVVGSRGRGGFSGLVLGSVSQQCAHHATCPLTIVPSEVPEAAA